MRMPKMIREFRFDKFRTGDTFHSRSKKIHADIIAYATAWAPTREGRKAAREAVRNQSYPNHSGTILDSWGQKYPIEASPRGYIRGDMDEYCSPDAHFVSVYRWIGFDIPERRKLCARTLERWARKNIRYDLPGAILSSDWGRFLFGWIPSFKNKANRLFCSEGGIGVLCVCGICGDVLPYNIPIPELHKYVEEHRSQLPKSGNPYDFALWQSTHPEHEAITGFYVS